MKKKYQWLLSIVFIGSILASLPVYSQNGGRGAYQFLNAPFSARTAALGSDFVAVFDQDITLTLANPSLINPELDRAIGLSYVSYFEGINYGVAQYAHDFAKLGTFTAGVQYMNYGEFDEADVSGIRTGTFSASDYALTVGWGRALSPRWNIGANFKGVFSSYETYNSFGLGVDVAISYHDEKGWVLSLAGRNIGSQLKGYSDNTTEPFPFNLQFGVSKKLEHLPVRLFAVVDEIDNWDLRYTDPQSKSNEVDAFTGEKNEKSGFDDFLSNSVKHLRIGGELTLAKRLDVRMGYNFRTRKDLRIDDKPGTVGFSWGVGLRLNRFTIAYSRSAYHLDGSPNWFTLTTNLSRFKK